MFKDLSNGKVLIRLYEPFKDEEGEISWKPRRVLVDKKSPNKFIYNGSNALWVHLLQQAMVITDIRNKYFGLKGQKKWGKAVIGEIHTKLWRVGMYL